MDRQTRHGLRTGLSDDDRADVERLLDVCNRFEELELPIFLEATEPLGNVVSEFLFDDDGTLIGFAWLPDDPEPEACVIVHPDHRRRGVGRTLVDAMRSECRRRGLSSFLLVGDEAAVSGKAFARSIEAQYRSSEYRLELDSGSIDRSRPRHATLHLSRADVDDADTLVRLLAVSFETSEEVAREQVRRGLDDPKRDYYLARLNGGPVGILQAGMWEEEAGITAFGVLPEYRGRGIGRQMLVDAVDLLLAGGQERILIEVATDNQEALSLYQSCGFKVVTAYGFYDLTA